jgi:hypothetical protein
MDTYPRYQIFQVHNQDISYIPSYTSPQYSLQLNLLKKYWRSSIHTLSYEDEII